jgi:adenylate cyclase
VLRRLNKRSVIHSLIVALFVFPALFFSIQPDSDGNFGSYSPYTYSPFLRWINRELPNLELVSADSRIRFGRRTPVNPQIVFLAIDQASTSAYLDSALDPQTIAASPALTLMRSSFPYPREVWALVSDRLIGAGARVVAFDLLFPGSTPSDDIWKAAIDRYKDKIVIATNFSFDRDPRNPSSGTWSLSIPSSSLFPDEDPMADQLGYVNFWPDPDDEVRDTQYRANVDSVNRNQGAENLPKLYSFAASAVKKGGHPELVPDDLVSRTMRFAGPPQLPFKSYSLYEIFDPQLWDKNFHNGDFFRDKIVLVGPAGDFVKDKSDTPYGQMDGAEIHLNAINDLLQGDFLSRSSILCVFITILLSGAISLALALTITAVAWRFLAALGVVGSYTLALILAYNGPGWLLPAVAPLGVFCGSTGTGFIYDFVLTQIEKLRLRTTFERYNSKNVVKYLLENTETYKEMLKGTRRPVTVLFSDIRSFTTIVETTADSHELVNKLNEYLTAMVACVFKYDGSLDKFMGDGLMAIWGHVQGAAPVKCQVALGGQNGMALRHRHQSRPGHRRRHGLAGAQGIRRRGRSD